MVNTRVESRQAIHDALHTMGGGDFAEQAPRLLGVLGYRSERTLPGQSGRPGDFLDDTADTADRRAFLEAGTSARIIFQVTDQEIEAAGPQQRLFRGEGFDVDGSAMSFLFTAVELNGDGYSRGRYAAFTREVNKRFPAIPAVVLFRTSSGRITLAFVHRRKNKRNPGRDVLGSVSLIREIRTDEPHRAHLDILADLSLENRLKWMDNHGKAHNFDGLLAAWLDALNTEALNKTFYRELFRWFDRAVNDARFPQNQGAHTQDPEQHVIRLITRLLFIWFIKEKGLVADDLFVENRVSSLLKDYDGVSGDSYYRAVLQNLFFATLNTEIGRRDFSSGANPTHRDFSRYRYRAEMSDPDALRAYFDKTPFINGGLFDCLDSEEATRQRGYRIDYFSDNAIVRGTAEYGKLSIPNRLFFDNDGLITLFSHYKFTVEENTPAEQEVALDPELLGKVFENLLAAYNPETRESARKQTGSYYTPRAVVDYMVDEALVASLSQRVTPADGDQKLWGERLHYLFDYNDAGEFFDEAETEQIVRAIASLKVLDPAVGSGAFPMGVLHKLTLALRRLDPDNRRWEALQREKAMQRSEKAWGAATQEEREKALKDISDTFERYRGSDFGRKLYLVQNSIYGVDIQPVACQIAKLRFFISLAIEQQPTGDPHVNYGIQPLPNLETRFVAADTLLGLGRATQIPLGGQNKVTELNDQLRLNRESHFHAGIRQEKLRLRGEDSHLRGELAKELESVGMSKSDAGKVAGWDPYDQNTRADWFDPQYMFDVGGGFDIVIGNPPYVQLQRDGGKLGNLYKGAGFATIARTGDIYQLFYEKGFKLLSGDGVLSYITSNSWLKAEYGKTTRRYVSEHHSPLRVLEMGKDVFESVIVDASILVARAGKNGALARAVDTDRLTDKTFPPEESLWNDFQPQGDVPWSVLSGIEQSVMSKMLNVGTPLKDWDIAINYGIKTGFNDAFIIDNQTKEALIARDPKSAEIIRPVVRGRDIQRFQVNWKGLWLIATFPALGVSIEDYPAVREHLLSFDKARLEQSGKRLFDGTRARKKTGHAWYEMQDACAYHEDFTKEKLLWIELVNNGRFAYDNGGFYGEATTFLLTGESLKYLCAVLNARLIRWFLENITPTSGMGVLRWKKVYVERLPIPRITLQGQQRFSQMIDSILLANAGDRDSLVSESEAMIDRWVYELYGLTSSEVAMVEDRVSHR